MHRRGAASAGRCARPAGAPSDHRQATAAAAPHQQRRTQLGASLLRRLLLVLLRVVVAPLLAASAVPCGTGGRLVGLHCLLVGGHEPGGLLLVGLLGGVAQRLPLRRGHLGHPRYAPRTLLLELLAVLVEEHAEGTSRGLLRPVWVLLDLPALALAAGVSLLQLALLRRQGSGAQLLLPAPLEECLHVCLVLCLRGRVLLLVRRLVCLAEQLPLLAGHLADG
mmetsp:Transcript_152436/g.370034  ORF Transcript_152436/g.370034 Transcript_152436/m.370034 type:complete len:222 (+) Transcript_152436:285-950(+)